MGEKCENSLEYCFTFRIATLLNVDTHWICLKSFLSKNFLIVDEALEKSCKAAKILLYEK